MGDSANWRDAFRVLVHPVTPGPKVVARTVARSARKANRSKAKRARY